MKEKYRKSISDILNLCAEYSALKRAEETLKKRVELGLDDFSELLKHQKEMLKISYLLKSYISLVSDDVAEYIRCVLSEETH